MKSIPTFLVRIAAAAGLSLALSATSAPVTYDFVVTATSGPHSGTSANGFFTFDSSIIPVGGGFVTGTLLSDLQLTWNGVSYDETDANTWGQGGLDFDVAGSLVGGLFGTKCGGLICTSSGSNTFFVFDSTFSYGDPVANNIFGGTASWRLRSTGVPEPATGALALLALGAAAVAGRRRALKAA